MNRVQITIVSALICLFASYTHATPIVVTAECINDSSKACATGITNLDIMGMIFDVEFKQGSFNSVFASSDPYFSSGDVDDPSNARIAADAIASVLNAPVIGWPDSGEASQIYIPYVDILNQPSAGNFDAVNLSNFDRTTWFLEGGSSTTLMDTDLSATAPRAYDSFATFTKQEAVVPVPATLALFGLGLVGLGWSRRKKA